ncbi:MAG: hypothetical protein H7061_02000 [Bdellovibrionaceae bacterium]|nr:hypothetical protein [Bdellovibrio sp.]
MKTKIVIAILISAFTFEVLAKTKTQNSKPHVKPVASKLTNSKLSTDVKFDGQMVGGKLQSPFESLAVVENEKTIDDLIGVRKNFSDRSEKSKGMR